MIYTVTLNPSIDYIVRLDSLVPGITNRTTAEEYYYGGKGINVSCVLAELDLESTAFGFVAGFTGDAIEKGIRNDRIITDFIKLESGISRINIKIKAGVETEINCQGPHISEGELERLFSKIDRISDGDTIVIAGNIPNTMPDDVYERILERIKGKDVRIVVDATKNFYSTHSSTSRSSSSRTDRSFPKCSELKSTPRMILKSMQKSCRNSVQKCSDFTRR